MRLGDLERVVVVGLGLHGEAAADALLEEGIEVIVTDDADTPAVRERARPLVKRGVEVRLGDHNPKLVDWADLIVPSPGVSPAHPILATAAGIGLRVWSEIELGWRLCEAPIIAITGTNGKTTTTALVTKMLRAGGVAAVTAGNNWTPLVEVVRSRPPDSVVVCEVSSFQLAYVESFHPAVAVVLNVADDHYDWHSGYGDYLSAKSHITENQDGDDFLMVKASDSGCVSIARNSRARLGAFDPIPRGEVRGTAASQIGRDPDLVAGVDDGRVFIETSEEATPLVRADNIRLPGVHNLDNVMGAALAAFSRGADMYAASKAIEEFEGLPHRTRWVAEVDGVNYVDDSKATNPHATLRALDGLKGVILIAGGRAKGLDLSVLAGVKKQLKGAVVMGEAAGELEAIFAGIRVRRAADVEEAVEVASSMASVGDTVLLSPAASSLDQYSSYAERGERFIKAVESRGRTTK